MLIEKETLDSIMTKDKGKLPLLPFNTLHLTEPCSSTFTTTPNHFGYGPMGQISVLESRTYTWTLDEEIGRAHV